MLPIFRPAGVATTIRFRSPKTFRSKVLWGIGVCIALAFMVVGFAIVVIVFVVVLAVVVVVDCGAWGAVLVVLTPRVGLVVVDMYRDWTYRTI